MKPRFLSSLQEIPSDAWNGLVKHRYPFARYEYLSALETSNCVGREAGWIPRHLVLEDHQGLAAALPLYEKHHSYGEYVFDWQWANAFEHYGKAYYPKLLTAIPFTPVTGQRILTRNDLSLDEILPLVRAAWLAQSNQAKISSWHLLFADSETNQLLAQQPDLLKREDVQFHWFNQTGGKDGDAGKPYEDFDHFLHDFRSSKRKQIKRERRKVREQGIVLQRRSGAEITARDWADFYACYQATYLKRSGHTGYLNNAFFDHIARSLSEQCMLVTAYQQDRLIASSLFFFDEKRLYGRYWGALSSHDCLHFEACYYQGIEFAIEKGLDCFDPGTQGEHKLVRGFEPTKTQSFHWIADPDFAQAIERFLKQERQHTQRYQQAAADHLPFHKTVDG